MQWMTHWFELFGSPCLAIISPSPRPKNAQSRGQDPWAGLASTTKTTRGGVTRVNRYDSSGRERGAATTNTTSNSIRAEKGARKAWYARDTHIRRF